MYLACKTHTWPQKRTHRQRLVPPASTLPPLCKLLRVLVEWRWNESYLIWETHLVPYSLSLSSNQPPLHRLSMSASSPAKPAIPLLSRALL